MEHGGPSFPRSRYRMDDILASTNLTTLAAFASSNVLLGFDYDGTLAPIVENPKHARMRTTTHRLLNQVARCYPCVVISGRKHQDIVRRLRRVRLWHVFGNHGYEPWAQNDDAANIVGRWVRRLRSCLGAFQGIVVEEKKYSVTVHYRQARRPAAARRAIRDATHDLPDVRVIGGDHAVNLIVRDGPNKGVALQSARRVLACETAIYVGDDDTDEDAFASAPATQLLAIRVGRARRSSRARYRLKTQIDIDRLLEMLLMLRTTRSVTVEPGLARRQRRSGQARFPRTRL